jgi:hypothetical protein
VKNESRFSTAKSTLFYSESNADSDYVILLKKYRGQKSGLTATCPLNNTKSERNNSNDHDNTIKSLK